jgi:diguanylate cyclase
MTLHASELFIDFSVMLNIVFMVTLLHSTRPLAEMGWPRWLAFWAAGVVGGAVVMHFGVHLDNGFLIDFRIIPIAFVGLYGGLSWALPVAIPMAIYGYVILPTGSATVGAIHVILAAVTAALVHTDSSVFYEPVRQVGWRGLVIATVADLAYVIAAPAHWLRLWLPLILIHAGSVLICGLIQSTRLVALRAIRENTELAHIDHLTGLPNLRSFEEAFESHPQDVPGALLLLDLDYFKQVNDTYGHLNGDLMLKGVADAIRQQLRQQDVVCRYGGEEFAVLLWHCSPSQASQIAERIRRAVGEFRLCVDGAGDGQAGLVEGGDGGGDFGDHVGGRSILAERTVGDGDVGEGEIAVGRPAGTAFG